MVEAEPALLLLVCQLRQTLVDGLPVAKMLESGGLALADGFLQVFGAQVADVFGEVHVDLRHGVLHQEEADFPEGQAQVAFVGIFMELDGSHAEAHLDEHPDTVE